MDQICVFYENMEKFVTKSKLYKKYTILDIEKSPRY